MRPSFTTLTSLSLILLLSACARPDPSSSAPTSPLSATQPVSVRGTPSPAARSTSRPAATRPESPQLREARLLAAQVQIDSFKVALCAFEIDLGRLPTTTEGLKALIQSPAGLDRWKGPYIDAVPTDPWGSAYVYRCPGIHRPDSYDLSSPGPDGQPGTADDITNWAR